MPHATRPLNVTEPLNVPDWLIINATRYALSRQTYIVADTTDWLLEHWEKLPGRARATIRNDLEEAFRRDDRAQGKSWTGPLGAAQDRARWERVRALWMGSETR